MGWLRWDGWLARLLAAGEPNAHRPARAVSPQVVRDRGELNLRFHHLPAGGWPIKRVLVVGVGADCAGQPDRLRLRPAIDRGQRELLSRVECDRGQVDALVVGRFDAIDQRASLDRDTPATRIDPWIRRRNLRGHLQVENERVGSGPGSFDADVSVRSVAPDVFTVQGQTRAAGPRRYAQGERPRSDRGIGDLDL